MSFVATLTQWLHSVPHLNLRFKPITDTFNLNINGEYVQSLALLSAFSLSLALLLLLIVVVVWICSCCLRKDNAVRPLRKARRLSIALFILSVICFVLLAACLYGNDHTNRGVTASIAGLSDTGHNVKLAQAQFSKLNGTQVEVARRVDDLIKLVEQKAHRTQGINQTLLREVDEVITAISNRVDEVKNHLGEADEVLADVKFLEKARLYGERIEFERWALFVTLLSIMLTVLFAGVIAFCRQSRKGAVVFGGLGIVIFIVSWLIFSLVFPLTVSLADFCYNGEAFLRKELNQKILDTLEFYRDCEPKPTHDNLPPTVPLSDINTGLWKMQQEETKLDSLLTTLFNHSSDISDATSKLHLQMATAFKDFGAVESTMSCYNMHDDVAAMIHGFCFNGILGMMISSAALLGLNLFLFILLLVVCKSWDLFTRTPGSYVEVDDDDPFYPREVDGNIPADIYGTHVLNPRQRFANSLDRTERSTETTVANAPLTGNSATAPLLDGGDGSGSHGLWQRSAAQNGSVPNSSVRASAYPLDNDGSYRYRPRQEQFDV